MKFVNKQDLRMSIKSNLLELDFNYKNNAAKKLLEIIKPILSHKKKVLIYYSLSYEINLDYIKDYLLELGVEVYYPVACTSSKVMGVIRHDSKLLGDKIFYPEELVKLAYNEWYNLDLIILPLYACDKRGYRLGKGGGYYDFSLDYFKLSTVTLCGVGFALQYVDELPIEPHDYKLDYFASEEFLVKF